MKRTFGLRAALIVLVLIAIAPVFAIVVKSSVSEQNARLERAEANLRSVVDLAAAQQQRLVDGAREVLAAIVASPGLAGTDWDICAAYMKRLQANSPVVYGTFGVLDPAGNLTCRAEPSRGVNSSDRPFFRTAVATGRFSVGEHVVSRATGKSVLPFGAPVYGADGVLRGVAYLAVDVDRSAANLREIELPPEIGLLVADRIGTVLAASGARSTAIGAALPEAFLRSALDGRSARSGRAIAADGTQWFYEVQPIGRASEGLLYVAGVMSMAQVLAPATQRLQSQLLALALITGVTAALAWAFGDRILVRPVQRLLGRVEALEREEADLRAAPEASTLRELRELEARFHAMARSLLERSVQRDGALAEVEGQNRLLASIFESMAEGVLVLDARGRFLHLNASALRIMPGLEDLRRERDPLAGAPSEWGLFHLDGHPLEPDERPVTRVLRGEDLDGLRLALRGRLTHDEEKIVRIGARELLATDGRRYGAVIVFSDITAEYRSEQELRRLNETLERRVAERTQELAVSNRELESFSYSVSHDLRAPLQVIDGFGRALMTKHRGQLDERARHYLQRISENTRQMGTLIDDLLSLSRLTRTPLRCKAVDLAARARHIVEQLRQRDPGRDLTVEIEDAISCVGDPGLLTILLDNLIGNAWKFTKQRANACIRVGSYGSPEGERVYFVADNGAGFDMAYAGNLFGAFQRLHAAAEFPGSGIGLATVHRIVTRHGGRVWADAQPGRGATFRFTIKGVQHEQQHDPAGRGQPRPPGTDPHDTGREQCPQ